MPVLCPKVFLLLQRMKQAVSITVLLCLLFSMSAKLGLLAHYYLNLRQITEEHCVNKNRPELNCNGSCYLSGQMKETETPGLAFPNLEYVKDLSPAVFTSVYRISPVIFSITEDLLPVYKTPGIRERMLSAVFQPPEL